MFKRRTVKMKIFRCGRGNWKKYFRKRSKSWEEYQREIPASILTLYRERKIIFKEIELKLYNDLISTTFLWKEIHYTNAFIWVESTGRMAKTITTMTDFRTKSSMVSPKGKNNNPTRKKIIWKRIRMKQEFFKLKNFTYMNEK